MSVPIPCHWEKSSNNNVINTSDFTIIDTEKLEPKLRTQQMLASRCQLETKYNIFLFQAVKKVTTLPRHSMQKWKENPALRASHLSALWNVNSLGLPHTKLSISSTWISHSLLFCLLPSFSYRSPTTHIAGLRGQQQVVRVAKLPEGPIIHGKYHIGLHLLQHVQNCVRPTSPSTAPSSTTFKCSTLGKSIVGRWYYYLRTCFHQISSIRLTTLHINQVFCS
jgi:hypothetical protein